MNGNTRQVDDSQPQAQQAIEQPDIPRSAHNAVIAVSMMYGGLLQAERQRATSAEQMANSLVEQIQRQATQYTAERNETRSRIAVLEKEIADLRVSPIERA